MALIYSRPRIKLPKILMYYRKSPKKQKMIKLVSIYVVIVIIFSIIIRAVTPIFNMLCIDKAKSVATIITNYETTNALMGYNYDDFIKIHKDGDGRIIMLESNMININNVISDVANKIQKHIDSTEDEDIGINIGSFTGISILSGRGYKIPIRISTIGNVKTNVKSEFIEKGINQTLHKIYLEIECEINILTPFNTINETVKNQMVIAENVIVGNIPNAYYNLEGMEKNEAIDIIE